MPRPHSSRPKRQTKPYPDFPLCWHVRGYWCKRIKNQLHYFGPKHGTPEQALEEYQRVREDLYAGRKPTPDVTGLTLKELCNHFLADRETRLRLGEITQRTWNDYHGTCQRLLKQYGVGRLASDLKPADFAALRETMAKAWGPTTIGNEMTRVRTVFKFGHDSALLEQPIRFGPAFRRPSARTLRLARIAKGPRLLEPAELRRLIAKADTQLRAMILLGLNCGLGNSDCARLTTQHLDLDRGWLDFPRPKTGIARKAKLWPETVTALRDVLAKRPTPALDEHRDVVFITKYRRPWGSTKADAVTWQFRQLLDAEKLYRPGISFYALRHVFETIAGEAKDQVAVGHVMGHVDSSMAGVYRERVSNERIEAVCNHVRTWLLEGGALHG